MSEQHILPPYVECDTRELAKKLVRLMPNSILDEEDIYQEFMLFLLQLPEPSDPLVRNHILAQINSHGINLVRYELRQKRCISPSNWFDSNLHFEPDPQADSEELTLDQLYSANKSTIELRIDMSRAIKLLTMGQRRVVAYFLKRPGYAQKRLMRKSRSFARHHRKVLKIFKACGLRSYLPPPPKLNPQPCLGSSPSEWPLPYSPSNPNL